MKGLRLIRERRGLTLQQMEEITGIALNTISRYERGVISPNADTALKIAQALGVTVDELLNETTKQEFKVKIVMGVKNLTGAAGIEIADNTFLYGVQDDEPQIHIAGKVRIDTPELREKALEEIIMKFKKACWMFDHKDDAEI
ncbi:MAG: helix-turn-helix transcriptional regulator [Synergistaceae bacterium]|nr:helix-turn-helix transcriptional regulator [Synergistaceae bacterium]